MATPQDLKIFKEALGVDHSDHDSLLIEQYDVGYLEALSFVGLQWQYVGDERIVKLLRQASIAYAREIYDGNAQALVTDPKKLHLFYRILKPLTVFSPEDFDPTIPLDASQYQQLLDKIQSLTNFVYLYHTPLIQGSFLSFSIGFADRAMITPPPAADQLQTHIDNAYLFHTNYIEYTTAPTYYYYFIGVDSELGPPNAFVVQSSFNRQEISLSPSRFFEYPETFTRGGVTYSIWRYDTPLIERNDPEQRRVVVSFPSGLQANQPVPDQLRNFDPVFPQAGEPDFSGIEQRFVDLEQLTGFWLPAMSDGNFLYIFNEKAGARDANPAVTQQAVNTAIFSNTNYVTWPGTDSPYYTPTLGIDQNLGTPTQIYHSAGKLQLSPSISRWAKLPNSFDRGGVTYDIWQSRVSFRAFAPGSRPDARIIVEFA